MGIVQNNIRRPRGNPRVFKVATGQVYAENLRGVSPGSGAVNDQRRLPFATRSFGGRRRRVG